MIYNTSASQHIILLNKLINMIYHIDFWPINNSTCVVGVHLSFQNFPIFNTTISKIFSKLSYALGTSRDVGFQNTYIKPTRLTLSHSRNRQLLEKATIIMDPLRAVEDSLGDVESWPICLIYDIFVIETSTIVVQMLLLLCMAKVFLSKKLWTVLLHVLD